MRNVIWNIFLLSSRVSFSLEIWARRIEINHARQYRKYKIAPGVRNVPIAFSHFSRLWKSSRRWNSISKLTDVRRIINPGSKNHSRGASTGRSPVRQIARTPFSTSRMHRLSSGGRAKAEKEKKTDGSSSSSFEWLTGVISTVYYRSETRERAKKKFFFY